MHTRFRNGILVLSILIFLLVLGYYFYLNTKSGSDHFVELTEYQSQIDSLKQVLIAEKKSYKHQPFNPNFITDYKGYTLGLSTVELDRLYAYRKENKWVNSIADFKRVTKVSDSLLIRIAPLFKFPEWIQNPKKSTTYQKQRYPIKSFAQKEELNKITAIDLQEKIGVPDFIAERIISYKEELGGFVSDIQLKDVKGLYKKQHDKILSLYTVKSNTDIRKVNINKATVKELVEVPYFDFEMALEIKDFIEKNKGISSFEELGKIEGFYLEKIDRIALYLTLN